jgi:hypothetical protein
MKHCRLVSWLGWLLPAKGRFLRTCQERHWAACPECRRQHENELALEAALRAHAVEHRIPDPPFLAGRIKIAVRAGDVAPAKRPPLLWRWVLPGVAMAVVVLSVVLWPGRLSVESGDPAAVEFTRRQTDALVRHVEAWSPDTAWNLAGGVDGSLQSELDALLSDARSAALLVVRACVPEETPFRLPAGE